LTNKPEPVLIPKEYEKFEDFVPVAVVNDLGIWGIRQPILKEIRHRLSRLPNEQKR